MQIGGSANTFEIIVAVQPAGNDQRVDLLVITEQVDDGVVNELVGGPIKIIGHESFYDVDHKNGAQQHGPEDALLRINIVGWLAKIIIVLVVASTVGAPASATPAASAVSAAARPLGHGWHGYQGCRGFCWFVAKIWFAGKVAAHCRFTPSLLAVVGLVGEKFSLYH